MHVLEIIAIGLSSISVGAILGCSIYYMFFAKNDDY